MTEKRFKFVCDDDCRFEYEDTVLESSIQVVEFVNELLYENEQLQERNDRQAETISELYNLIEKEDWKVLQMVLKEFKLSDELLAKEWKCYAD